MLEIQICSFHIKIIFFPDNLDMLFPDIYCVHLGIVSCYFYKVNEILYVFV